MQFSSAAISTYLAFIASTSTTTTTLSFSSKQQQLSNHFFVNAAFTPSYVIPSHHVASSSPTTTALFGLLNSSSSSSSSTFGKTKRNKLLLDNNYNHGVSVSKTTTTLFESQTDIDNDVTGDDEINNSSITSLSETLQQILDTDGDGETTTTTTTITDETVDSVQNEEEEDQPLILEEVPPASYSIQTESTGPNQSPVHTLTIHLGAPGHPNPLIFQTGKIGRQAAGAITLSRGDTIVYATVSRDKEPKESIDFLPLSVEHQERFSSAGLTSGSYNRRDGRPAEHEVLTCRLIDRPLRPLIADGWRHETQILSWVLSYDGERNCDPLAIIASAAALYISDVPLTKPVAAAMVGYIDGQFVLNPTNKQMEKSKLHLTVAGTKDAVLMIEGAADFLSEELMVEAVTFGHGFIKVICEAMEEFGKVAGKEKNFSTIPPPIEGLSDEVDALLGEKVEALWNLEDNKAAQGTAMSSLSKEAWSLFEEKYPEKKNDVMAEYKKLLCRKMFEKVKKNGKRYDGRAVNQVRPIDVETSFLPKVHGSALFTRGETQTIATATLGDSGMKQKIDRLDGLEQKRFYLQYSFPPSCVGETGRVGAPGRREIGHGNLAERALAAIIPSEDEFPYTIRVESLITESHGSSSMASVCGGCLALMDSGVPVKKSVAGIAMGMLLNDKGGISDENAVILSDLTGTEDALGTMDFKVAGDREGITTFQLDIKCEGLTIDTLQRALAQAKEGRSYILDKMDLVLASPRSELPPTIPRMAQFKIPEESIGKVIGPGGKQIRAIIDDFDLNNMDVAEDGNIQITGFDTEKLKGAENFVMDLIKGKGERGGRGGGGGGSKSAPYAGPEPVEGEVYKGKITGIHQFGVFVEILPGAEDGSYPGLEGLCHVSELHIERVRNCEGFMNSLGLEELEVKYLGKNDKGKHQLSRKAVLLDKDSGKKRGNNSTTNQNNQSQIEMSKEEIDVIAKAIEGIGNL